MTHYRDHSTQIFYVNEANILFSFFVSLPTGVSSLLIRKHVTDSVQSSTSFKVLEIPTTNGFSTTIRTISCVGNLDILSFFSAKQLGYVCDSSVFARHCSFGGNGMVQNIAS